VLLYNIPKTSGDKIVAKIDWIMDRAPNIFPEFSLGFGSRQRQALWIAGHAPPPSAEIKVPLTRPCGDVVHVIEMFPIASKRREVLASLMSNSSSFTSASSAWASAEATVEEFDDPVAAAVLDGVAAAASGDGVLGSGSFAFFGLKILIAAGSPTRRNSARAVPTKVKNVPSSTALHSNMCLAYNSFKGYDPTVNCTIA
jgi:hypothetical protein